MEPTHSSDLPQAALGITWQMHLCRWTSIPPPITASHDSSHCILVLGSGWAVGPLPSSGGEAGGAVMWTPHQPSQGWQRGAKKGGFLLGRSPAGKTSSALCAPTLSAPTAASDTTCLGGHLNIAQAFPLWCGPQLTLQHSLGDRAMWLLGEGERKNKQTNTQLRMLNFRLFYLKLK